MVCVFAVLPVVWNPKADAFCRDQRQSCMGWPRNSLKVRNMKRRTVEATREKKRDVWTG